MDQTIKDIKASLPTVASIVICAIAMVLYVSSVKAMAEDNKEDIQDYKEQCIESSVKADTKFYSLEAKLDTLNDNQIRILTILESSNLTDSQKKTY